MKICLAILLIASLFAVSQAQTSECYAECYRESGCQKNQKCITQLFHCDNNCDAYSDPEKELECFNDCKNNSYDGDKLSLQFKNFLNCQHSCLKELKNGGKKQTQDTPLTPKQKLRQEIAKDPFKHTGETLLDIDCDKVKKKKKVYVLKGNTHAMIIKYFESRCDFELMPAKQRQNTNFDFKWCDFHFQHNYKTFKAGKQIINHVQNLKDLISFKDKVVRTYREFDQKKLYGDYDSTKFHFDTYLFNLKSKEYNEEEKYFFDHVNDGYWITKDPDGSLGLGIKLFRNVQEIKDAIADIKAHPERKYDKKARIAQYSVIQKYLHDPLLIDKKKIDLRGYVLIASLEPFVVLYQNGFIRKCIKDYDNDFKVFDHSEAYKHLTNRIYQEKHPSYPQEKENLMLNPLQFEEFLRKEHNFTDLDIQNLYIKGEETVAYSMMAAKEKFIKQKGIFQLMGVDLIWDDKFNVYLIEFNTSAGLYQTLKGHKYVVPQLVQSTLDLITESFKDVENVGEQWKHPENLDLGRWEILINDATGYNILDKYKTEKKSEDEKPSDKKIEL